MNTRTSRATKGLYTSLIQFTLIMLMQAILAPFILKHAGQDVFGSYAIVTQIIGYGLILDFGLGVAINRFLSQSFGKNGEGINFIKIFNSARYLILLSNSLISIFILILSFNVIYIIPSASNEVISNTKSSLIILSLWTIIRSPLIVYGYGLHSTQNMATIHVVGIVSGLCRLLLSLYLVFLGVGLIGLVIANIFSEYVGLLIQKYYFNKIIILAYLKWKKPNVKLLKKLFYFGLTYWGVNVAIVLSFGSDAIIVGHLYGATAAAIIYTTKIPTFLVIQIIYKIVDNSTPAANELIAQGNYESLRIAYLKILRYSFLLALPASIGIIVFNRQIIILWVGIEQFAGNITTIALAIFVLTQVVNHINAMILVASGNMKHWMPFSIFNGFITIILAYLLGKNFGMQWVIVGIVIMDIPALIFLTYRSLGFLKLSNTNLYSKFLTPIILQSCPLAIYAYFLMSYDAITNISELIFQICIFIIIWLISLFLVGIDRCERKLIINKFFSPNINR